MTPPQTSTTDRTGPLIIAIDGPAGSGKSTVARRLARRLGVPYLDTGAMYRATGLLAARHGMVPPYAPDAGERVADLLHRHELELVPSEGGTRVLLDGEDVSVAIRTPEAAERSSAVSTLPPVRRALVEKQRRLGRRRGGVMEGRDIGSVVFPDARLKVYLDASLDERARRRHAEVTDGEVSLEEVREQLRLRDQRDSTRGDSPLKVAPGALVVDTTGLTPDEVVDRLAAALEESFGGTLDSAGEEAVRSRNHGS